MNSRQKKLILKIQNKWNLYLSEIAKAFNVSEKTIRNDIVQINSIYGTQKLIIENSKIKLTSPIDIKSLFFRNYQKNKTDFSVNDRRLDILYELVINDQHFSYSFLSNHYMVSKSSIAKDIDYIKKKIKKYHLVLSFDQTGRECQEVCVKRDCPFSIKL
ncbi:HTH domain-containing protein, partial [Liquorilactobacillus ghanensis]|uniref:HTH domain-containing protein n=1 Tax=Liquorilactobacillus ghanensis TaxID=399370 RepID=UPI000B04A750